MSEDELVKRLRRALADAQGEPVWSPDMEMPDAVDELDRWLADARQWSGAGQQNWTSLIDDVTAAVRAHGELTQSAAASAELCRELRDCRALLGTAETRLDESLRQRLRRLARLIRDRFCSADVRAAAWGDLTARSPNRDAAERAARQVLALAAWAGHGKDIRSPLDLSLRGYLAERDASEVAPAADRLAAAEDLIRQQPRRAHVVVWLRIALARVDPGWLDLGDHVRLYHGEWLREVLDDPQPHHELPAEAFSDNESLKLFCGEPPPAAGEEARPIVYARIAVGEELLSKAVGVARDTAEAIGSLGVMRGADPSIWRLEPSYLTYADGNASAMSESAPVVRPTVDELMAVRMDRTAEGLAEMADELGRHLPVRDPELHAAATLLGWLKQAHGSPAPIKLVLFDRVVEASAGWAGINSMHRFIRDALIPWWAYQRIRDSIYKAGYAAVWSSRAGLHDSERRDDLVREIMGHPPLQLQMNDLRISLSLQGVLTEIEWLRERVTADSDADRRLAMLARRTSSGASVAAWWTELCTDADRIERRRHRTRNALVHGGPLSPATVDGVAQFAEYLAGEAVAACVQGRLTGKNLVDHFLDRDSRVADMRAALADGAEPSTALFFKD